MSLTRAIAKNTLIQIISKIISTILGVFSLGLMTRYLGQAGFGQYSTITTFLTFFAVIADFGLTLITSQMMSEAKSKKQEQTFINNLFSFRLISISVFILLAIITVFFFPYDKTIKLGVLIASLSFIFPALNQILIGVFQKKLRMDRTALAELTGRTVLFIEIVLITIFNKGLNAILIATIISALVNFIVHYVFVKEFVTIKLEFNPLIWKKIIHKSWPLAISITLNLIYLKADVLLLSLFKSFNDVGLYEASYRIINVLTTIPFMFAGIIFPIMTTAWLEKKIEYFKIIIQKSFDFMAILAIPLVIGTQFLATPIMITIAGPSFSSSGPILQLLIFSIIAIFLGTIFSHAVIAINKQKKMIKFYILVSLTSLIAYLILIPKYSYFGAASVTIYSEVLIAFFSAYCVIKTIHFVPKLNVFFKSLLASLIMAIMIYLFPNSYKNTFGGLSLIIILSIIVYFVFLYLFKGIRKEEIQAIINK